MLLMKYLRFFLLALVFVLPTSASAATFEVTGWIPYWRTATGTADVLPHLDSLTEINPFVYTLKQDGTIVDNGNLDAEPWLSLVAEAKKKGVRVIPTIMSSDREFLHRILSDQKSRIALEDDIAALVKEKGFDGIDIDFENKSADTREYFSTFLKGLYQRMGKKWVMCTIETRIPNEDRYYGTDIPADANIYSNDLKEINKYCDRVRLMAYDQQGIDLKLQADAGARLYAPVGDPAWVEKVVKHMSKDITKSKILIGVPTYGYEYAVTAYANNQYVYDILWTFNPGYAYPIAAQYGITPERAFWGEMAFSYVPVAGSSTPPAAGSVPALAAAAAASQIATAQNTNLTFRYLVWPDATSVQQRIDLAKKLGVRGISVFKFDGGQDPGIWGVIAGAKGANTPPSTGTPAAGELKRGLDLGMTGEDVRTLQRILNADPDTRVSASGVGSKGKESTYFGAATGAAVKKFQVKYGLAKAGDAGYGFVGPKTRAKLNQLLSSL
jgi:spore germination protein YaaH